MTSAVDKALDGTTLNAEQAGAWERLNRMQAGWGTLAEDYAQAVLGRDWETLGMTPEEWQSRVFAGSRLTLDVRRKVAQMLHAAGKTLEEIGDATGTAKSTAQRDISHSGKSPSDQPGRNAGVTKKAAPKSGAQRASAHRERRKDGGAHLTDCTCPGCSSARPAEYHPPVPEPRTEPSPAAVPEDGLAALREQIRAEEKAELKAKFEQPWNAKLAEIRDLKADVARLERENAELRRERDQAVQALQSAGQREPDDPGDDRWSLDDYEPA